MQTFYDGIKNRQSLTVLSETRGRLVPVWNFTQSIYFLQNSNQKFSSLLGKILSQKFWDINEP